MPIYCIYFRDALSSDLLENDFNHKTYSKWELNERAKGMAVLYAKMNNVNLAHDSVNRRYYHLLKCAVKTVWEKEFTKECDDTQEKMLNVTVLRVRDELDISWKALLQERDEAEAEAEARKEAEAEAEARKKAEAQAQSSQSSTSRDN